jgi:hypothetical protein
MLEEVAKAAGGDLAPFCHFARAEDGMRGGRASMTIRFTEGDGIPDDVLGFTEDLYKVAVVDLRALIADIRAGQVKDVQKAKSAVRDLFSVGKLLIQERANVETLRKQVAGTVGTGGELDLGAARDEIGRRLACLRDARGD